MKATLTFTGVPDAKKMRGSFTRILFGLANQSVQKHQNDMALKFKAPPSVKRPIEWFSEAQRIKVIILLKEAGNLPYRRTGRLENAWRFYAAQTPDGATVILQNPTPYSQYVYGSFRGQHQQRFHVNSGWNNALEARRQLFDAVNADVQAGFIEALFAFGSLETSRV